MVCVDVWICYVHGVCMGHVVRDVVCVCAVCMVHVVRVCCVDAAYICIVCVWCVCPLILTLSSLQ